MQSCRWPELLRASLLADGGTYMLGATFGQPIVGDDNRTTLSPGIVIWTADDNASAFVAPVGGVLQWCPEDVACPDPERGVLRLKPRPTGEGGQGEEGDLHAHTDLFVQWIQLEGMDRDSVAEAIGALAGDDQNATAFFEGAGFGVEPGDYLGKAAIVEDAENYKRIASVDGGEDIILSRRVLLAIIAADYPAYLDPYLFFPEEVDSVGSEHDSLLGDDTPPDISDKDIRLYPHAPGQSVAPVEPRDPNESIPHYGRDP